MGVQDPCRAAIAATRRHTGSCKAEALVGCAQAVAHTAAARCTRERRTGRSKHPATRAHARKGTRAHKQADGHTTRATNIFKCTLLVLMMIHVEPQAAAGLQPVPQERGSTVQLPRCS